MKTIEIDQVHVEGVKADFVKQEVRLTLSLPLNTETLAMRFELSELATDGAPSVRLTLEPKRGPRQLSIATGIDEVTLSARGPGGELRSVTLGGNGNDD